MSKNRGGTTLLAGLPSKTSCYECSKCGLSPREHILEHKEKARLAEQSPRSAAATTPWNFRYTSPLPPVCAPIPIKVVPGTYTNARAFPAVSRRRRSTSLHSCIVRCLGRCCCCPIAEEWPFLPARAHQEPMNNPRARAAYATQEIIRLSSDFLAMEGSFSRVELGGWRKILLRCYCPCRVFFCGRSSSGRAKKVAEGCYDDTSDDHFSSILVEFFIVLLIKIASFMRNYL